MRPKRLGRAAPPERSTRGGRYLRAERVKPGDRASPRSATPGRRAALARHVYCSVSPGAGFSACSLSIAVMMRSHAIPPSMSSLDHRLGRQPDVALRDHQSGHRGAGGSLARRSAAR
jgi:hypothetical protein